MGVMQLGKIYRLIDVGAGFLETIAAQAMAHPEHQYLAIEPDQEVVDSALVQDMRIGKLANLTIDVRGYREVFRQLVQEGHLARHIAVHADGHLIGMDVTRFLGRCKPILVPNGKIHWTNEAMNRPVGEAAKKAGFKYIFKGEVPVLRRKSVFEKRSGSLFEHEFTLGLKKAVPKKEERRNWKGSR